MPQENAEGHVTWNPSVGLHHNPARVKRESYGGIVGALQDQIAAAGVAPKAYPENFAGIIAAIQDLQEAQDPGPPTHIGPQPPGGEIIIDIDGNPIWIITDKPDDGDLWFDTRQGRLFTWIERDWYQTNGGDGIPIVTPDSNPPAIVVGVPGQMWYDRADNKLYIFSGMYAHPDSSINTNPEDGTMIWKLVADLEQDFLQTTATLPLVGTGLTHPDDDYFDVIPELPTGDAAMTVQKDYNEWVFDSLAALDQGLSGIEPVYVSETPPDPIVPGQLWYDTDALEMSIAYQDGDGVQWVPVSAAYNYDSDLDDVRALVATETRHREQAIHRLQDAIGRINNADAAEIELLRRSVDSVEAQVEALPTIDLEPYLLETTYNAGLSNVYTRIDAVEAKANTLSNYATISSLNGTVASLQSSISEKASTADLQAVQSSIPDVSAYTTQEDVAAAIDGITAEYLTRSGGVMDGTFTSRSQTTVAYL